MERVTISQLKNSLSAYLKKVRAGQTVLILDRDEPIAMLERVDNTTNSDERLCPYRTTSPKDSNAEAQLSLSNSCTLPKAHAANAAQCFGYPSPFHASQISKLKFQI